MTDDNILTLHVDAVRTRSLVPGEAGATQQRIVASLRARRRRKQRVLRSLIWAGLVLPFGSTSYALIYGVPAALRPLLSSVGLAVKAPIERAAPRKRSADATQTLAVPPISSARPTPSVPGVASQAAVLASPSPAETRPTASGERSSESTHRRRARASATLDREPAPVASSVESDEALSRRLYARAHELHFVARDREAALRAWDDYLAHAPLQVLRIEAEYNRALCLVRLGRNEEALRELAPFADGTHGAYRRRESAALMRALSR